MCGNTETDRQKLEEHRESLPSAISHETPLPFSQSDASSLPASLIQVTAMRNLALFFLLPPAAPMLQNFRVNEHLINEWTKEWREGQTAWHKTTGELVGERRERDKRWHCLHGELEQVSQQPGPSAVSTDESPALLPSCCFSYFFSLLSKRGKFLKVCSCTDHWANSQLSSGESQTWFSYWFYGPRLR